MSNEIEVGSRVIGEFTGDRSGSVRLLDEFKDGRTAAVVKFDNGYLYVVGVEYLTLIPDTVTIELRCETVEWWSKVWIGSGLHYEELIHACCKALAEKEGMK